MLFVNLTMDAFSCFYCISFIMVMKPKTLRKANLITELAKNPLEKKTRHNNSI